MIRTIKGKITSGFVDFASKRWWKVEYFVRGDYKKVTPVLAPEGDLFIRRNSKGTVIGWVTYTQALTAKDAYATAKADVDKLFSYWNSNEKH